MNVELLGRPIPFFDYRATHGADLDMIMECFADVTRTGEFILKRRTAAFEAALAARIGVTEAVATSSATLGMTLILKAWGIGPGDEVITPSLSYTATAAAIDAVGARIVFCDVDPDTFLATPATVSAAMGPAARAILIPHLFRRLADLPALRALADKAGLLLLEDAATALGGRFKDGRPAGAVGHAGVYSFFPAKPLGGLGDGGIIITEDGELARRCRMLRNHGQDGITRFVHHDFGFNARMDEWNAGYLLRKLDGLDAALRGRDELAARYDAALTGLPLRPQAANSHCGVPYAWAARFAQADALADCLMAQNIGLKRYRPLNRHPAWAEAGGPATPIADTISAETIALPFGPGIKEEQVSHVAALIRCYYA
jgi:dTDP-4-amino-4,6-dideoxygalactose transaminase